MQRFLLQYENNVKIFSPENAPHSAVPTLPSFRALRSPHSLSSHPAVPLSFRGSTATVGISPVIQREHCDRRNLSRHSEGAQQPRESPIPPFRPWDSFGTSPLRMTSPRSPRHSAPPFCRSAPPFCHSAPPFCHSERSEESHERSPHPP